MIGVFLRKMFFCAKIEAAKMLKNREYTGGISFLTAMASPFEGEISKSYKSQ